MTDDQRGTLVTGGHWLDLDTGEESGVILRYRDGRLSEVGPALAPDGKDILDATGALLVPGFTDLHAHVFRGLGEGVDADTTCLARGSTTVVDGGSAGAMTVDAFAPIAQTYAARVRCWLNLSSIGIIDSRYGELIAGVHIDIERTIAAARAHPGFVIGFKARLSADATGGGVRRVLEPLREVADATELPVMVHIGDTFEPLSETLAWLKSGDVVTHTLTGRRHGILEGGELAEAVPEARERGIIFDAASGRNHWSFDVMEIAFDAGFLPDTLSSDVTVFTARDPSFGQALMGTRMLSLGLDVHDVLARMSRRPASFLGFDTSGELEPGQEADVTVVRLDQGAFEITDVDGRRRSVDRWLSPIAAIRSGHVYRADDLGPAT